MCVNRVFVIVLDSLGIGALPDAHLYGDEGSNTLGNMARALGGVELPNLAKLGMGKLLEIPGVPALPPLGACGRMAMASPGKDTMTGHWELCGVILDKPFRTYPNGFPGHIVSRFEGAIGRKILGNKPVSGTVIIEELGELHMKTGYPIVYTSADSVFQIACHEEVVPLDTLYEWCREARSILVGDDLVARVIARPFVGRPGSFKRTANRKDFSLPPVRDTLLDYASASGVCVTGVGKIHDIFAGRGIHRSIPTGSNTEGIEAVKMLMAQDRDDRHSSHLQGDRRHTRDKRHSGDLLSGGPDVSDRHKGQQCRDDVNGAGRRHLVLANLVDFDMLYGHRNNVEGYAAALRKFDSQVPALLDLLTSSDVLVVTADHGCDPTTPSTDHSREYVPLLIAGGPIRPGVILGTRSAFADLGATLADLLEIGYAGEGASMKPELLAGV